MKTRDEAWTLVTSRLKTRNLQYHLIASEACMGALAARLGEDRDLWALAGLVHDIDLDEVEGDPARHGLVGAGWLEAEGYPADLVSAVRVHAGHGEATTKLEKGLVAVDPTTGFIVACALVRPDRSIVSLETSSIRKRMKEKRFAANVNRDQIRSVEALGVGTDDFLALCLEAMRAVRSGIGL